MLGLYHFEKSRYVFTALATVTVVCLAGIFFFLASVGLGAFRQISLREFLFGLVWNPTAYGSVSWGIGALLMGTMLVSVTALALAVPIGLAVAIYLSELASPRAREFIKPAVEMISSIPSVVLGLLGLLFFAPLFARLFGLTNALNALTAALLVSVAALPTIASICDDALSGVPQRYREASLALGASQWETIRKAVLPAAKSGLLAGILLGFARIIGETMIVLMVAGNSVAFPRSLLDPVRPLAANIAIEIKEVVIGSLHWQALFAIGLMLFVLTFIINLLADVLVRKKLKA